MLMDVKDTKIVSIDEVIDILEEKGGTDPTYEQQLALQHAKKLSVTKSKGEKLKKELEGTGLLTERSVVKILEIMPKNQMTLRQILAQERKTYSDEEVNKIFEITKEK
jgi:DNA-directed RNA polymerase subunit F